MRIEYFLFDENDDDNIAVSSLAHAKIKNYNSFRLHFINAERKGERQEFRQHNNDMNVDLVFTLSSFDFPFDFFCYNNKYRQHKPQHQQQKLTKKTIFVLYVFL